MYQIKYAPEFVKAARRCKRQGRNMTMLWEVVSMLAKDGCVPDSYRPHLLRDEFAGCWECHIEEDWLLVWRQNDKKLILLLTNTGSHEDLFVKRSKIRISL